VTRTIEIRVPKDQQEGTRFVLQGWMKKQGDTVAAHEPVAELETDKVVVELASPAAGVLQDLHKQAGDELIPGEVMATLLLQVPETVGAEASLQVAEPDRAVSKLGMSRVPTSGAPETPLPPGRTSPAVRRMLSQLNLSLDQIAGTGRGGRVTARDIEASRGKPGAYVQAPVSATLTGDIRSHDLPHDSMRRRIAAHMLGSVQTAPHVTTVFEADLSAVLAHKANCASELASIGKRLTLTAYFVAASALAMRKVPVVNSRWHEDHLQIFDDVNIGVGTSLGDKGLVVPVLRKSQDMDLYQVAEGLEQLTAKARKGALSPAEVQGGTFTISNHGVSGSLIATPIVIHQPQSAILGVGKLEKRVIVREIDGQDSIQVRPMCYVTLTLDHRVLDGFQANSFLGALVSLLENWPLENGRRLPALVV
jgi:2-oxoglutarate dehydrogenase E2 component (dihydrolipoamide succinyltransferase)